MPRGGDGSSLAEEVADPAFIVLASCGSDMAKCVWRSMQPTYGSKPAVLGAYNAGPHMSTLNSVHA